MTATYWTPERVAQLTELKAQGLSCEQIRAAMGAHSSRAVQQACFRNRLTKTRK